MDITQGRPMKLQQLFLMNGNALNPVMPKILFKDSLHSDKFLQCTYLDLFKFCSFTLYVELSDPQEWDKYGGKYPRFHLHGTITMPSTTEELLHFKLNTPSLISQYGRVQVNNLRTTKITKGTKTYKNWLDYCTKDQKTFGKYLKCYNSMDILLKKTKDKKNLKE